MIVQSLRNHVIVAAMEPAGKATEPYPMILPAAAARPEAAEASATSAVAGARLALTNDATQLAEAVTHGAAFLARVMQQANQVVVGQTAMLERILIGLCAGGHCLIEGVPGLAKTLAVKTVADATTASFARIQFTPDLLPADITGTMIYNMQRGEFTQKRGPLFANLVLADEVNRAPAKVQSALLEAMQERQVTIGEQSHPLPDPFLVLATQNPIEQEGTYALPEAQLDRFMLLIKVDYPTAAQEREMLDRQSQPGGAAVTPPAPVASVEDIRRARALVPRIFIEPRVRDYIVNIVQATRHPGAHGLAELVPLVQFGGSPRATLSIAAAARAHAFLRGRAYVIPEDIAAIVYDVLRHRIVLTFEAEAEEIVTEDIIRRVMAQLPIP